MLSGIFPSFKRRGRRDSLGRDYDLQHLCADQALEAAGFPVNTVSYLPSFSHGDRFSIFLNHPISYVDNENIKVSKLYVNSLACALIECKANKPRKALYEILID